MKVAENEIFCNLKRDALQTTERGEFQRALQCVEVAAQVASFYNHFYANKELDKICAQIARRCNEINISPCLNSKRRVVYIDSNCLDNHGLTQQYLRALIDNEYDILFIRISTIDEHNACIMADLYNYEKAEILIFQQELDAIDKFSTIMKRIQEFSPNVAFFHLTPWDSVAIMVASKIANLKKYYINAIDHTYWLGASFMDRIIEFRDYGKMVSCAYRDFKDEQCYKIPYYPIINNAIQFQGLPHILKEQVTIFSGGQSYKMLSKDDKFFKVVDRLLDENKNAILVLIPLGFREKINSHVNKCKNKERIVVLEYRKDIAEIFKHIDIYLNTMPVGGGLMTQYAAMNNRPILSYVDKWNTRGNISGFFMDEEKGPKSYQNIESFFAYAHELCANADFRIKEGKEAFRYLTTREQFALDVKDVLDNEINPHKFHDVQYGQKEYEHLFRYVEDNYLQRTYPMIWNLYGWKALYKFPRNAIQMLIWKTNKFVNKRCKKQQL